MKKIIQKVKAKGKRGARRRRKEVHVSKYVFNAHLLTRSSRLREGSFCNPAAIANADSALSLLFSKSKVSNPGHLSEAVRHWLGNHENKMIDWNSHEPARRSNNNMTSSTAKELS